MTDYAFDDPLSFDRYKFVYVIIHNKYSIIRTCFEMIQFFLYEYY